MKKIFLYAKIHQACVTHADLNYEGSFAIDEEILEASTILENEQIHVYNINNGARFITYAIKAKRYSKIMGANGACARLVSPEDRVIICAYAMMDEHEWKGFRPNVLHMDKQNNITNKL